jgi:hypothetical protein
LRKGEERRRGGEEERRRGGEEERGEEERRRGGERGEEEEDEEDERGGGEEQRRGGRGKLIPLVADLSSSFVGCCFLTFWPPSIGGNTTGVKTRVLSSPQPSSVPLPPTNPVPPFVPALLRLAMALSLFVPSSSVPSSLRSLQYCSRISSSLWLTNSKMEPTVAP